jgi:glycerol-3-phosphate dehydrogenase
MAHGRFGTAINCIDGRVQFPVANWMKKQFHLDYVDMITEPGHDKVFAHVQVHANDSLKAKAQISALAHGSTIIVIAGHDDCAGNPVERDQHLADINKAVQTVHSWNLPFEKVIGVWVNKDRKIEVIGPQVKAFKGLSMG